MSTIFQKTELAEPALFSPSDTTKKIDGFPKICVSTFSENIVQKFGVWDGSEKIAELLPDLKRSLPWARRNVC